MRLRGHRPLDLDQPLFVKRGVMAFGVREFRGGDTLPWRDLALTPRKVRQLWEQRRIGHEKPGERNGAELPQRAIARTPAVVATHVARPAPQAPSAKRR